MNEKLKNLQAASRAVSSMHHDHAAAISASKNAEHLLLSEIIEQVKDSLPAICSRIVSAEVTSPQGGHPQFEFSDHRGVRVAGIGPRRRQPNEPEGRFEGRDLYLMSDGTWMVGQWSGQWSRRAEKNRAFATFSPIDAASVAEKNETFEEIIYGLECALREQINGRITKRTASLAKRADLISAILLILKQTAS